MDPFEYGHVTGTGGWVQGRDYINPAIKPIMDEIAEGVWRMDYKLIEASYDLGEIGRAHV